MNEQQRQAVYLIGVMVLLTLTVLYLFVYASDPLELYRPSLPSLGEFLKQLLDIFNVLNYL